ncbi:hypothetical protein [Achromobacter ruhlandii]|uniref:hypothetical protein n=1 Tax=Achromobacter ruhlandii TaxID=72557 RepID=UPI0012E91214|nr:hypothetical protein [Achromobacter ruhlandii]
MTNRRVLKEAAFRAWKTTIEAGYSKRRINTEGDLQAFFWQNLRAEVGENSRTIFVQPRVKLPGDGVNGKKTVVPDIVVCNSRSIIGVIELKYRPRTRPNIKKDLDSLQVLAQLKLGSDVEIKNERFLGEGPAVRTQYNLAQDVLWVWAGVYCGDVCSYTPEDGTKNSFICDARDDEFRRSFIALHAETSKSGSVKVFAKSWGKAALR